MIKTVEKL